MAHRETNSDLETTNLCYKLYQNYTLKGRICISLTQRETKSDLETTKLSQLAKNQNHWSKI